MKKAASVYVIFLLGLFLASSFAPSLLKSFNKNSIISASIDSSDGSLLDEEEEFENLSLKKIVGVHIPQFPNTIEICKLTGLTVSNINCIEVNKGFKTSVYAPPKSM